MRRTVIGATSREALVQSGELKPPSAGSKDSTARSVGFGLAVRETEARLLSWECR
jgi:hypothetical protein